MTCHNPHGTVANNLLKQGEPFLCLQCHEMHFHNARIAPTVPAGFGNTFSNNPNGKTGFMGAFTRSARLPQQGPRLGSASQGVTGGGKALTR
jgi:predicted CXXCH cytochrome family protein